MDDYVVTTNLFPHEGIVLGIGSSYAEALCLSRSGEPSMQLLRYLQQGLTGRGPCLGWQTSSPKRTPFANGPIRCRGRSWLRPLTAHSPSVFLNPWPVDVRLRWPGLPGAGADDRRPAGETGVAKAALDDVREFQERDYPLGNEVYRDENGAPLSCRRWNGDDDEGNRLRGLIENHLLGTWRKSELGGELLPHIHITEADKQAAVPHKALDSKENPPSPVTPFQDSLQNW